VPYVPLGRFVSKVGKLPDDDAMKVYITRWAADGRLGG
jgi:hypothetical protein